MSISVEIENPERIDKSEHVVHVFVDRDEIKQLIIDLESLSRGDDFSSIRLFSESWGNGDLSKTNFVSGSAVTNFLRITLVPTPEIDKDSRTSNKP